MLLTLAGWTSSKIAEAFGVREDAVRFWRGAFLAVSVPVIAFVLGGRGQRFALTPNRDRICSCVLKFVLVKLSKTATMSLPLHEPQVRSNSMSEGRAVVSLGQHSIARSIRAMLAQHRDVFSIVDRRETRQQILARLPDENAECRDFLARIEQRVNSEQLLVPKMFACAGTNRMS